MLELVDIIPQGTPNSDGWYVCLRILAVHGHPQPRVIPRQMYSNEPKVRFSPIKGNVARRRPDKPRAAENNNLTLTTSDMTPDTRKLRDEVTAKKERSWPK